MRAVPPSPLQAILSALYENEAGGVDASGFASRRQQLLDCTGPLPPPPPPLVPSGHAASLTPY